MPDGNRNQPGRMLFTDFDASDKGRPISSLGVEELPNFTVPSQPILMDIASTIDLDFEDDGDSDPAPVQTPAQPKPSSQTDTPPEHGHDSSQDATSPDGAPKTENGTTETPPSPDDNRDAADASQEGGQDNPTSATGVTDSKRSPSDTDTHVLPAGTSDHTNDQELSLDDPDIAKLNTLPDPILRPETASKAVPTWQEFTKAFQQVHHEPIDPTTPLAATPLDESLFETIDAAFPMSFASDEPSASGGAADDYFLPSSTPQAADDDDDEIGDVLSMLTSMTEEVLSLHPVPLPPSIPYGDVERISDWYAPPEHQADGVSHLDNWYEPPTPEQMAKMLNDKTHILPRSALPTEAVWNGEGEAHEETLRKPTRRFERKTSVSEKKPEPPPASDQSRPGMETAVDLFSGLNLEDVWEEKVKQHNVSSSPEKGGTRRVDLFEDLDLESLWEERVRHGGASTGSGEASSATGKSNEAESTILLNADELKKAGLPLAADTSPHSSSGESPRPGAGSPVSENAPTTLPALDPAKTAFGGPAAHSEEDVTYETAASLVPVDFLSDLSTVGEKDGTSSFGEAIGRPPEKNPEVAEETTDEAGKTEETAEEQDSDDGERDYLPGEAEDNAPSSVETTTDDIIDNFVIDDEATDETVTAPVIDNSAIATPTRSKKPSTDELAAILDSDESAVSDDEMYGDDDSEEGAEPVALNPMDVFANMDDMDFSDDVADDLREIAEEEEAAEAGEEGAPAETAAEGAKLPTTFVGKLTHRAVGVACRILPEPVTSRIGGLLARINSLIAWRENWWFYCDLAAAIIASASMAIIISYWVWYRS